MRWWRPDAHIPVTIFDIHTNVGDTVVTEADEPKGVDHLTADRMGVQKAVQREEVPGAAWFGTAVQLYADISIRNLVVTS